MHFNYKRQKVRSILFNTISTLAELVGAICIDPYIKVDRDVVVAIMENTYSTQYSGVCMPNHGIVYNNIYLNEEKLVYLLKNSQD